MYRFIGLVWVLCLFGCIDNEKAITIEVPYEGAMMTANNIKTIYSDSGETKMILEAPVQLLLQNDDREFPEGVHVEFFDEKKEPKAILTSNYALFDKDKNLYRIFGKVVIDNKRDGKKMSTEELFWSPATKKIYTDKFLIIETGNEVIRGIGMDATQDFSSYKIHKPVGELYVK
ncbi:LPS export ABC transporter periplasmic protein LptC [uncultured Cytophaga sp.]|uniref:LPS export ABC transporter periplasmic protein LptC n=1 Tax=uncultured Cytophaga sp. TaxID=160238 RepID=UPI002634BE79|nr:LPS export ABC transporter periplasmic protein LptC [uncultured Cytophaga sp.]